MFARTRQEVVGLLAVAILMVSGFAVAQGEPAPEEMTGLTIGETVPEFELNDQDGESHSLKDILAGEGTTVLMFYRSANW